MTRQLQRRSDPHAGVHGDQGGTWTPGKGTLVEQLPVQARGELDGEHVHRVAAQGVRTASAPLPHGDRIQALFGRHDVSGIRATVGGDAAQATGALGAQAYATGDRIAFAQAPDVHLAAHEAAHVVQQRGGVQLSRGIGQAGDAHERHADAVADKVVRGESAEALLDTMASGGGGARAVQRSAVNATGAPAPAASPAPPTGPSRTVSGGGRYVYRQFADGTIQIVSGPTGVGKVLLPSDPKNKAITAQIGPFVSPSAPAPAAGTAPPAAPAPGGGTVDTLVGAVSGAVDAVTGAVTDAVDAIGGVVDTIAGGFASLIGAGPAGTEPAPVAPGTPAPAAPAVSAVVPVDPANHQSRATFVGPALGENATTTQILDTIWPYFHKDDVAISGFMTDAELIWKVNFHWDEILWVCDKVSAMDGTSEETKTELAAIASSLTGHAPDPGKGAYLPNPKGVPVDKTTPAAFDARYLAVKSAKPKLAAALSAAGIFTKYPKDAEPGRSFQNACDFLNPPSTSKHAAGYALDIKGDEARILAAAKRVGMTGCAKEAYTHVEFANGAHAPTAGEAPAKDK